MKPGWPWRSFKALETSSEFTQFALLYQFLLAKATFTLGIADSSFWRLMTMMLLTDHKHLSEPGQGHPPPTHPGADPPVGLNTSAP